MSSRREAVEPMSGETSEIASDTSGATHQGGAEQVVTATASHSAASQAAAWSTPRARTLRARPSLTNGSASTSSSTSGTRKLSEADLQAIQHQLGPAGVAARRDELVQEKEALVKVVVDEHDTALREQFHLERFITMITGWDPALAKVDNSPVFMDYKRFQHNLFELVPQSTHAPVAGPSRTRGARASFPSRQTRRQAHEQADVFVLPSASSIPDAHGSTDTKGKGKAKASAEQPAIGKGAMPPPPVPAGKGKKGRRQTLDPSILHAKEDEQEMNVKSEPDKGRKRGRASMPAPLPVKKDNRRSRKSDCVAGDQVSEGEVVEPEPPKKKRGRPPKAPLSIDAAVASPEVAESSMPPDTARSPTPEPVDLPSLAGVPLDPPPVRYWPRKYGSRKLVFTDPPQQDVPDTKFAGDLFAYLNSYIHLEDTGPIPDIKALETRAEREGFLYNRTNYLMNQGRLSRLLDEDPSVPASAKEVNKPHLVIRQQDHQEAMMSHMTQVRNAILGEAKAKPVVCRKVARMVMAYWDHIEGREERERLKVEKEMKRKGKELVKGLRKRWALAVKVIRAKITAEQKAEQDRLGKEHLQSMLRRSTGLLEAQQEFDLDSQAEEMEDGQGEEGNLNDSDLSEEGGSDQGGSGDENDDDASEGTDAVSAAEDSEMGDSDGGSEVGDNASDDDVDERAALLELLDGLDDLDRTAPLGGIDAPAQAAQAIAAGEDQPPLEGTQSAGMQNAGMQNATPLPPDPPAHPQVNGDKAEADHDALTVGTQSTARIATPQQAADTVITETRPPSSPLAEIALLSETGKASQGLANGNSHSAGAEMQQREALEQIQTPTLKPSIDTDEHADSPLVPDALPIIRSRRARGVAKQLSPPKSEDPDVNDNEFSAPADASDVEDEDHAMDVEMEEDEAEGSQADSEDAGLLADADIPIAELLKRYGYDLPAANGTAIVDGEGDGVPPAVASDQAAMLVDQSLTDTAIGEGHSPTLVLDGKRQRRARHVWTPEDNPPRPAKKPKIEMIEAEQPDEGEEASSLADSGSEEEEESEEEIDDHEAEQGDVDMGGAEEDPNAPKIRPPFLLRGNLRPYQHAGLDWLAGLYANNMNGILADEMGLGKTIQTISLLAHLACDRGVWGQHLIIVPTSVILNWEMEFKKFLPGFKVLTYYGNQKERKEKRVGWLTENAWQVCITSYQIVLADQHIFRRKSWTYMILDEAHNIKNFRSQRWQTLLGFKAQRRLLLTGTPLQNNLMELWSLLYFLMPHGVAEEATAVVGFANHKDFMEWFSNPMDKAIESGDALDEETLATVAKLHTLLRPFILRRLKSEVETQLPGKFEHVVYCKLSKRQRFLYDEFMSRASTREALSSGGYLGVMNTLMQLRKVCNHPDLFEVRPVRTSFAMERSVASDFTPTDILVRQRLLKRSDNVPLIDNLLGNESMSDFTARSISRLDATDLFPHAPIVVEKGRQTAALKSPKPDTRTVEGWLKYRSWTEQESMICRWRNMRDANRLRCRTAPIYGSTLLTKLTALPRRFLPSDVHRTRLDLTRDFITEGKNQESYNSSPFPASPLIMSLADRTRSTRDLVERFAIIPPNAVARDVPQYALPAVKLERYPETKEDHFDTLHHAATKLQIAFPDASLLQYDCGKLQKLYEMLRDLKAGGHRVLIFTQMTRVLDILEMFLSFNGHRYLRLDGSTKIEDRQVITERFNSDARIFCFIASSRSGGVGINLTGADTVFFYDSDWNPSMDRQCMDRAHRIGQTREVHIYRFVSSHTVEENMLKKANQKRLLDRMVIQEGDFTTEFFGKVDWRNMIDDGQGEAKVDEKEGIEDVAVEDEPEAEDVTELAPRRGEEREFARIAAEVEDEEDVDAARIAQGEGELDMDDFDAAVATKSATAKQARFESERASEATGTPVPQSGIFVATEERGEEEFEDEDDVGAVDEFMLRWVEEDWTFFASYRA